MVRMEKIWKRFDGVRALQNVDLEIGYEEIIGLVGDNGAGKSTLIKILAGVYTLDKGEIFFEGERVKLRKPKDAKDLGIETIYQELALADNLDVARNIFMGREFIKPALGRLLKIVDKKRMWRESDKILRSLKIEIPSARAIVGNLSGGQRQGVAIGRIMYTIPKLLIADEPTAAISIREREKVLRLLTRLKKKGVSIIFISHNLQEIFSVVDRIFVLNRGRQVGNKKVEETSIDEVVKLMLTG